MANSSPDMDEHQLLHDHFMSDMWDEYPLDTHYYSVMDEPQLSLYLVSPW
jgi:hypothetical protein